MRYTLLTNQGDHYNLTPPPWSSANLELYFSSACEVCLYIPDMTCLTVACVTSFFSFPFSFLFFPVSFLFFSPGVVWVFGADFLVSFIVSDDHVTQSKCRHVRYTKYEE
ncbi:hypothetical protein GGI35DRAFT_463667 [Trichoderma velutinum]